MFISPDKISKWLSAKSIRSKNVTLSQKNIYIFPTQTGFAFLLMLLVMLLTAINYQNSLIYLITFFLGSVFFLSIWLCFLNLSGLELSGRDSGRAFQGESVPYSCLLSRKEGFPIALKLGQDRELAIPVLEAFTTETECLIQTKPKSRGRHHLPSLYLESRYPFGLIVAWAWPRISIESLVYPAPVPSFQVTGNASDVDSEQTSMSGAEYSEMRAYTSGDPLNRVLWKKLASSEQLVIRDHDSVSSTTQWLDWNNLEGDTECRLSLLCFEICRFSEMGVSFGLKLPGVEYQINTGNQHKIECLDALALFGEK